MFGGGGDSGNGAKPISYQNRGNIRSFPYIKLDKDAGIGDKVDTAGGNEENIHFGDISKLQYALIVANIYGKSTNFAQYNGKVTVAVGNEQIIVPLTESKTGSWCAVALIDNSGIAAKLVNINRTVRSKPSLSDYI